MVSLNPYMAANHGTPLPQTDCHCHIVTNDLIRNAKIEMEELTAENTTLDSTDAYE